MTSNQYHFISRWRVEGTCGEVADVLSDPLAFPRWWPSVYLDVRELEPPGAGGVGRRVALESGSLRLPEPLTGLDQLGHC